MVLSGHLENNEVIFSQAHQCLFCSNANLTHVCHSSSELSEHLNNSHSLSFDDYITSQGIQTFSITDIPFRFFTIEFEANPNYVKIEKKPFLRVNGEIVKRKWIGDVETWERMFPKKNVKVRGQESQIGGLKEIDKRYIPEIDNSFILSEAQHIGTIKWMNSVGFKSLLLTGDTGLGKSDTIMQVCARMNYPTIKVKLNGNISVKDLFWAENWDEKQKKIVYEEKAVLKAMRRGYLLMVDEISAANPIVNMAFFELLEKGSIVDYMGKSVKVHKMAKIIFTDNRIGNPNYYRYHGTFQQNSAFINRIRTTIRYENLNSKIEKKILDTRYPQAKPMIDKLLKFSNLLREQSKLGNYQENIPIRSLETICENYEIFQNNSLALEYGYLSKIQEESEKEFVLSLWQRVFGSDNSNNNNTNNF